MPRDASIPLFLWIATAVLVHLLWGGGADQAARVIEERLDVGRFAASVQRHVKSGISPPIEVSFEDDAETPEESPETKPQEAPADPASEVPTNEESSEEDEPKKAEEKRPVEAPPEAEKEPEKEEEKEKEPEKVAEKKEEPKKVAELQIDKRIAVKQFVEDPDQKDNPEARHLADQANHVKEETHARITSNTENLPDPNPGSSPTGPSDDPGNASETRVAQDQDLPGEDRAPNERPSGEKVAMVQKSAGAAAPPRAAEVDQSGSARGAESSQSTEPGQRGQQAREASQARAGMPETLSSEESVGLSVAEQQAPSVEQKAKPARKARALPKRRSRNVRDMLGFGAAGVTPNGVSLNVTPSIAAASIGMDELSRLRKADGERRRSAHRGKFRTSGIERWRSAIENYTPSVKPGNQTALNTARAPFASYLNSIHNRLHPIFADTFLASLDGLPGSHPMNQPDLNTTLEIVLDEEEGRIVKMGVTKTSGVTAFDIAALDSVHRAGPFGTPPTEIVSPDGNVYLHWEFHRNMMACSTLNAFPFMLKVQPKSAPPPAVPSPTLPPLRPSEPAPGEGSRHGSLERPRFGIF